MSILWGKLGGDLGSALFGTAIAKYLEPRDCAADVRTRQMKPMEDIS
jgi:hypothetical protein